MTVSYTNRKGRKYTLYQGVTKTGKPRYFFSREQKENPVAEIPPGYEITESVNGVVSLSKTRPKLLFDHEIKAVRAAIKKHPSAQKYRVDAKAKVITIYEQVGPDIRELATMLTQGFGISALPIDFNERLEREHNIYTQYTPVMRFTLSDKEKRLFNAERMSYLASVDGWLDIEYNKTIEELARTVIPALDTDEFYELW